MTVRNKYLLQLKNKMLFHFTASAIAGTLADINQIFDAAAEKGKTEEEVCKELGEPGELAGQMIQEDSLESSFSNSKQFSLLFAMGLVLGTGILAFLDRGHSFMRTTYDAPYLWTLPALGIPAFLLHLSGGRCLYEFSQNAKAGRINLLSVAVTLPCVIMYQVGLSRIRDFDTMMKYKNLILGVVWIAGVGIFLAAVLGIFAAVRLFLGEYIYFPALLLSSGFYFTSMMYRTVLRGLDDSFSAWIPLLLTSLPYFACLLCALGWYLHKKEMIIWTHR